MRGGPLLARGVGRLARHFRLFGVFVTELKGGWGARLDRADAMDWVPMLAPAGVRRVRMT